MSSVHKAVVRIRALGARSSRGDSDGHLGSRCQDPAPPPLPHRPPVSTPRERGEGRGGEGRAQVAASWKQRCRGRGRGGAGRRLTGGGKGWGLRVVRIPPGQGLLPAQCQG